MRIPAVYCFVFIPDVYNEPAWQSGSQWTLLLLFAGGKESGSKEPT